jgi:hypothetical protein
MKVVVLREGNPEWKIVFNIIELERLKAKAIAMAKSNFTLRKAIKEWDSESKGLAAYFAVNIYQYLYACNIKDDKRRLQSSQELLYGFAPDIKEVTILSVDAPNTEDHDLTIQIK